MENGGGGGGGGGGCAENDVAAAAQLKKILEWELSLDARDLRSHAWYHGAISRAKAEHIVAERDGDFLVRDCTSQPGNYVLSCRSKGQNLHFVINKMVLQANTVYESVQYRFEDDGFDTVPDLITYYVGSGKPITIASAAKIQNPRNRRHPLSFYSYNGVGVGVGDKYDSRNMETRWQLTTSTLVSASASPSTLADSKSPTTRRRDSSVTYASTSAGVTFKKQRSLSLRANDVVGNVGAAAATVNSSANLQPTPGNGNTRANGNYRKDSSRTADGYLSSNSLPRTGCWPETGSRSHSHSRSRSRSRSRSPSTEPLNVNAISPGCGCGFGDYINPKVTVDCRTLPRYANKGCAGGGDYGNADADVGTETASASASALPPPKPSRPITVPGHSDRAATRSDETSQPKSQPKPSHNCSSSAAATAVSNSDSAGNGSDDSGPSCDVDATDTPETTFGVVIKNPKYAAAAAADDDDDKNGRSWSDSLNGDRLTSDGDYSNAAANGRWTTPAPAPATHCYGHYVDDQNALSRDVFRLRLRRPQTALAPASASAFDLDAFHTLLLPTVENKPLDTCALQSVHMLLMDSGSRILANHLTRADLELTMGGEVIRRRRRHRNDDAAADNRADCDYDYDYDYEPSMCKTGIELSFLPQGRRHRYDLIERSECLRLLVAVTILMCATESERAELLNKWILVAIDTKTALGNLYGFCGIMLGLCTPQVLRLKETWHILRQRYTDSAFNFEAKLRPTLKCMNDSTNPLAPNTTIPHLLPAVLLYETNYAHISEVDANDDDCDCDCDNMYQVFAANSHLWDVCINQWEACSPDLGLGTLYAHLNASRQFYNLLPTFKRNAEIVLTDSKIDHLLCDLFRTEFHMKFLWGSRGAQVNASERYAKFQQVLNVMSEKCETIDYDDDRDHDHDLDHDRDYSPGSGSGSVFAVSKSPQRYTQTRTQYT